MGKQFVIYSACIGSYDNISQPKYIDDRFDYILFTDELKEKHIGVWEVRKVDYNNSDKTRIARYIKTHPHTLLPQYKATVWLDANLEIISPFIYERSIELCESKTQLASIKHPTRDCIYDEAYWVYGLDSEIKIFEWCHFLRNIGYPRHNGLYETNVLFRINDENVADLNEQWWKAILEHSRRDQLSLNYLLWNSAIPQDYILPIGEHAVNSSHIRKKLHNNVATNAGRRGLQQTKWEHFRNRCRMGLPSKHDSFQKVHYFLYQFPVKMGMALLNLWTIYAIIIYGPRIKYEAHLRHIQNNG